MGRTMMNDHSRIDRTGVSGLGEIIRDEGNEDDKEFFVASDDDSENEEDPNEYHQQIQLNRKAKEQEQQSAGEHYNYTSISAADKENTPIDSLASFKATSSNQYISNDISSADRYVPNLTKITEVPDESFSFKHGADALQLINDNHEQLARINHFRLPSGSFHHSHYLPVNSWEESACRNLYPVARSELDLSQIQFVTKLNSSDGSKSHHSNQLSIETSTTGTHSQNRQPFISGTRFALYFGFRQIGYDSCESLGIHNIHPNGERVKIICRIMGSSSNQKTFKLEDPPQKIPFIMAKNSYKDIVVSFTPTNTDHYRTLLIVECQSRNEVQKYKFILHGFGGRALLQPLPGLSNKLALTDNGRNLLMVDSLSRFHFNLKNQGNRAAFASISIYNNKGDLIEPPNALINMRNFIVDKDGREGSTKTIDVRLANIFSEPTPRPSTRASSIVSLSTGLSMREEYFLRISVIWGEERQRQRLKQLERIIDGAELRVFGRNFTRNVNFIEEGGGHWKDAKPERLVTEEEFFYFDRNVKHIFIDVYDKKHVGGRTANSSRSSSSNIMGSIGSSIGQPPRTSSSLSVASSSTAMENQRSLMGGDNTLVIATNSDADKTLTGA